MVRAALLCCLLAGCGFFPEDDFTGQRAGDGIAPWQDLGPIQVCVGNQYLGPPDSVAGGLCFDASRTESVCVRDGDCETREACVCGRCTVAYCSTASDCGNGRTCTFAEHRCDTQCFGEDDCAGPEECFNGVCRGRCIDASDCQIGEVCSSQHYCVTADCTDDDGCTDAERCIVQRTPRQALEPDVTMDRGLIVLWLEVSDEVQRTETAIYRAESRDGIHFQMNPAEAVVEDGTTASSPTVVQTSDGLVMYYDVDDGAAINVVTSTDGITWSDPVEAIPGGIGGGAVRAPSAVALPTGEIAVYYERGTGLGIALATGLPGGALEVQGTVLAPPDITIPPTTTDAPFWDDVERVGSPEAAITTGPDGRSLRLYYSAYGRESADSFQFGEVTPIPPNYSIGYASASIDDPATLRAWPYGPVVDRVSAFLSHHDELGPGVIQLGDDAAYLMYYLEADPDTTATGPDGPYVIGRLGVLGNGAYAATTSR